LRGIVPALTRLDREAIPREEDESMAQQYNNAQLTSYVDQIFDRLRAIEAQMAIVSEKVGVPYEAPSQGAPDEVVELAQAGDRMGAIKKYRELTGAGLEEAQEAVAGL
jgi:ribosomal protein L7/L12